MAIITFTSDFGTANHYVAAVKGRFFSSYPEGILVDISHQIPNSNIAQAAFLLHSVLSDFPDHTIHIVAVDTHTANNRHLLAKYLSHYFIVPDNGLLGLLFGNENIEVIELEKSDEYLTSFPAKSLYAPVAAALANNTPYLDLGRQTDDFSKKVFPTLQSDEETLRGHVIYVDTYGNLVTNFRRPQIEGWKKDDKIEIHFGHEKLHRISRSFADCDYGDCILMYNATEHLMIGIRQGNAAQLLGMRYDSSVIIKRVK